MSTTETGSAPRLSREAGHGRPAAPVRIVHLGLGNFFRAHQAWYTEKAPDAAEWGIAAFTGLGRAVSDALQPQGGLYTLITRAADADTFDVISSVVAVHASDDHDAWLGYWRSPDLAIVTLTVTEAGYLRASDGHLDASRDDVQADVEALRSDPFTLVTTAPGRIVAGLLARRDADAGPVAIVPCDNLPSNGPALNLVVDDFVRLVDPSLAEWVAANVVLGTTMVDRITPRTTEEHRAAVLAATGRNDASPVPTEPFVEWVIQSDFPNGRPAWDAVGARIVNDVVPFEERKLWLLNGSHSLLAYAGSILGHETVADAITDPRCLAWVRQWWAEASAHVPLPADDVAAYCEALVERFENPNIRHELAQIAADGSQKIPVRIVPTIRAELQAKRVPLGAARVVAAWVAHLRGHGAPITDARATEVKPFGEGTLEKSVDKVLGFLGADLVEAHGLRDAVVEHARELIELDASRT